MLSTLSELFDGSEVASIEAAPDVLGVATHRPRVFTDFDGTVALQDVTDEVLRRFAPEEWEKLELAWRSGEIDAAACMRGQIALIEAPAAELDAFLDRIELDPGFPRFAAWCAEEGIPLAIVSDGVDYFARRILARHGLGHLPLFANRLVVGSRYALEHPWLASDCRSGAGVCKCAIAAGFEAAPHKDLLVYVGDGHSDRCISRHADLLFAKDDLASHCRSHDVSYFPFETFEQVSATLRALV
jgi:2-hydroxy-3-keto-5-methylthiopentenyl-1-phosphate phosphatase